MHPLIRTITLLFLVGFGVTWMSDSTLLDIDTRTAFANATQFQFHPVLNKHVKCCFFFWFGLTVNNYLANLVWRWNNLMRWHCRLPYRPTATPVSMQWCGSFSLESVWNPTTWICWYDISMTSHSKHVLQIYKYYFITRSILESSSIPHLGFLARVRPLPLSILPSER